jgi:hypothetical protein
MTATTSLIEVLLANSSKGISKFLTDCSILEMPCTASGNYVEISMKELILMMAEKFSDETLDPVATNGITDLFGDGNAESWMIARVAPIDDDEIGCITFAANGRQICKFKSFTQSCRFTEAGHQVNNEPLLGSYGNRETLSPLGTATLDNETAVFGCHADEKTVSTFTGYIAGLECAFHIDCTSFVLNRLLQER